MPSLNSIVRAIASLGHDLVNNTNNVNAAGTNRVNAVGANTNNELPFDPKMPALEDISTFNFSSDHENDDKMADMYNLDTIIHVSPTPTIRIHKDHPIDQMIGDLHSTTQTRNMSKNLEEHWFVTTIHKRTNHKDLQNCLFACFLSQEKPKKIDVKSAFLYRKIKEEVYVCQPLGFEDPDFPDKVYKVKKALYGLHQAPRVWYETLSTYLLGNGFHRGKIDKTLFIRRHKNDILLVQVYVDDIIFGLQVKQKQDGIFISQDKYVDEILKKYMFLEVKNASTPMETQKPLLKDEDGEEVDVHMYRLMIGSLMYLTSSRPDIMFCYALTVNPTLYTSCIEQFWATVKMKIVNEEVQLQALVDGKKKPKRKFTKVPQPSDPKEHVANEAVNEEMDDSLERDATTATNLDAEQDRGNIFKTQSKATPNETGSQRTSSGGGPKCQETIKDIVALTRSERVSKISNDPLLAGVNTPRSGDDSLKLNELMELCTKLQQRVLDLETTKITQALEIDNIKRRVKKLEKETRVESSTNEGLGEENASKQGRIADIDASEDIYLVNVYNDEDMFGVNDLDGDEVIVESVDVTEKSKEVVGDKDIIDDVILAKALMEIKSAKPKADKVVIQEPEQGTTTTTPTIIIATSSRPKAKGLFIHEQEQAPTPIVSSQQPSQEYHVYLSEKHRWKLKSLKKKSFFEIQELFDKAIKKVNTFVDFRTELVEESTKKAKAEITQEGSSKRAGDELEQEISKKQKVEDDKDFEELKKRLEIIPDDGDDATINATPLSSKSLTIVDYKIYQEGNKIYFQIFKADGNSQMYLTFSKMLKFFDREDLEVLWRLVKARFEKVKPVDHMDSFLLLNLKTMFEHHVEDNIWKI
nr:hypothetical protein [Tanacetum cinerariifolium]